MRYLYKLEWQLRADGQQAAAPFSYKIMKLNQFLIYHQPDVLLWIWIYKHSIQKFF